MIDRSFWKTLKEHQWLDDTSLYLVEKVGLYFVVLESSDDVILDTYSSFDRSLANAKYNEWKNLLMKNHQEWTEELLNVKKENVDNGDSGKI